jgi:hypothetical protein
MQIPFGEWLPDYPPHLNPGANVATNVYYAATSYKPFPSLVTYSSNDLGANSKGAGSFRSTGNVSFNFAATPTDIYQLECWNIYFKKIWLDRWRYRLFYIYTIWRLHHCN